MKKIFFCASVFAFSVLAFPASFAAIVEFTPVENGSVFRAQASDYGAIEFYAQDESGQIYYPKNGRYVFTKKGFYTLGGRSVYNFCYSDSAKVYVDEHIKKVEAVLNIACE